MTQLEEVSGQLEAIAAEAGEHAEAGYEGVRDNISRAFRYYMDAMFPSFCEHPELPGHGEDIRAHYLGKADDALYYALLHILPREEIDAVLRGMEEALPKIFRLLLTDIRAGYEGDPAAKSEDEIILAYPAFTAIGAYRIAHVLYEMGYALPARLMTEYAHSKTGIDIHPGAKIGEYFFIDHGTGVVIGETTVIGSHVKLYQHVTLGAKSFPVGEDGILVKNLKRHPNIGDYVVIYAGATILGGDVTVGDHCVIGGNVWLTHSVPAGETVYYRQEKK